MRNGENQGPKKIIINNTIYNIINYAYISIISFFLVPYIIKHIGMEKYGIWAFVYMILGYFSITDLGMGQSFERYIAEYYSSKNIKKIHEILTIGIIVYITIFAVAFIFSEKLSILLIHVLNIPIKYQNTAFFVFKWTVIYFGIYNFFNLASSIIRGTQKMQYTSGTYMILHTLNFIGTIFVLENNYDIKGLIINSLLVTTIGIFIHIYNIKRIIDINISYLSFNGKLFKRIIKFSIKRWINIIEDMINYQTDKFFISNFLTISLVGIYQVGLAIPEKISSFIRVLTSAIVPATADFKSKNEVEKIKTLYFKSTKYIAFTSMLLLSFIFINSYQIIYLWLGKFYNYQASMVLKAFCIIFVINLLSSPITTILVGYEKPEYQMYAGLINIIINVILTFILIQTLGIIGAVSATIISTLLSTTYLYVKFYEKFKIKPRDDLMFKMKFLFITIISSTILYILNHIFYQYSISRIATFFILSSEFIFYFFIFTFLASRLNLFNIKSDLFQYLNIIKL